MNQHQVTRSSSQTVPQSTHQPLAQHTNTQTLLLHQYIQCLEKQNQTKNIQRQTLYAQLQRLEHSISDLQQQLTQAKSLTPDTIHLISKIRDLQQQVTILKYEQQHLFEENLAMIGNLEQTSNKLLEVQRENKELKSHKEQLEKFRQALQKITQNLEQIQIQRFALAQANMVLIQENTYLKTLLQEKNYGQSTNRDQEQQMSQQAQNTRIYLTVNEPNRDFQRQTPQITSVSNYLMSNSFEKISQYEQEYEESNGNSCSRNQSSCKNQQSHREDRESNQKEEKLGQEWEGVQNDEDQVDDQRDSLQKKVRLIGKEDSKDQNQSSYLIFDQRSGESFSLSFELNHTQRLENPQQSKPSINNDNQLVNGGYNQGKQQQGDHQKEHSEYGIQHQQEKYQQQSSNDVIQEINDEQSLRHYKNRNSQQRHSRKSSYTEVQSLKQQILRLRQQLHQSITHQRHLQGKILQMENTQSLNMSQMQSKIEQLLTNYESIVNYTQELQQDNIELYKKNEILQNERHQLLQERHEIEQGVKEFFSEKEGLIQSNKHLMDENTELKIKLQEMQQYCLQAQEYFNSMNENSINNQNFCHNTQENNQLTTNISQYELIRQNNQLIQRLNQLQMQKSALYNKKISSQYSKQSSYSNLDKHYDKENCFNSLNYHQMQSPTAANNKFFRTPRNQEKLINQNAQLNPNKNNTTLSFRSQIQKQQSMKRRNSFQGTQNQSSYSQSDNRRESQKPTESLKEKLQKRIECIKKENIELLNELEYY